MQKSIGSPSLAYREDVRQRSGLNMVMESIARCVYILRDCGRISGEEATQLAEQVKQRNRDAYRRVTELLEGSTTRRRSADG